jgi:hypothetical protein
MNYMIMQLIHGTQQSTFGIGECLIPQVMQPNHIISTLSFHSKFR